MNLFLDALALLAGMAGFWTLLFQTHLLRKIAGWFLLQASFGILLLTLTEGGRNPLPEALILDLGLVTFGVGALLLFLARLIRREKRTLNSKMLSRVEDAQ